MQQANLLQLSDGEFHKLVTEVEQSLLFRRLFQQDKLIHYRRFPGSSIYPRFYELKDSMAEDTGYLDVESLISVHKDIVPLLESLGPEKFKRFFLFPKDGITLDEIAAGCHLTIKKVETINSFIDDFTVMSEFYHPAQSASQFVTYSRIASIEKCGEDFVIGYFSPFYARGRYVIDYAGFEELIASDRFDAGRIMEAKQLLKQLELINYRQDTIHIIISSLTARQKLYLESGNPLSLLPFSQKELAAQIGLAPSSVSRAVHWKSVVTPWGEEIPLKYLLPTPKCFKKELIMQLLRSEPNLTSDEATRIRLQEKLGVAISRRSVSELRKELKLPARGRLSGKML